ncbi:MAG: exodeoxyribonuclease III [Deltaproteobacteria bacterium]|nr:exodeoxyribonuclease III [Deltaproteobacteria bacterium]
MCAVALKVLTWNVNGIRARSAQVLALLADERPDVVCLQEIKASPEKVPGDLFVAADYHAHWHGQGGYSGVALLLRRERFAETPRFTHPPFDLEHRIVVAEVGTTVFASVYVPNGGKDFAAKMSFLRELDAWAAELAARERRLVLSGDLNVARTDSDVHPVFRAEMIGQLPEERALLESLFARGLVDVGRSVAPDDDRLFTWWAPWRNARARNLGWRLDYVVASRALVGEGTTCVSRRDVGTSDHGPVIALLRGP